MPQLWTETYVAQYIWFIIILLIFYFFVATKVIPSIANAIKIRQVSETTEKQLEVTQDTTTNIINLFNNNSKQEHSLNQNMPNWDIIQNEWLLTTPENNNIYWIETTISEDSKQQLITEEDSELSLEEFLKHE